MEHATPVRSALPALPLGAHDAYFGTDIREFEFRSRLLFPQIRELASLLDSDVFPHLCSMQSLGGITFAAVSHLSCRMVLSEGGSTTLVLPHVGRGIWQVRGRRLEAEAAHSALLLSGAGGWGQTEGGTSGLYVKLDPLRLADIGRIMLGVERVPFNLGTPRELPLHVTGNFSLRGGLGFLIGQLSSALENPALVPLLKLDDLFYRFAAILLAPEPFLAQDVRKRLPLPTSAELDQLCDYIRGCAGVSIGLTDLEAMSGFPRASIYRAFRRTYGRTPVQWIRNWRMQEARRILETRGPEISVAELALTFGFRNAASFSRAFQAEHGVAPEVVAGQSPLSIH